MNNEINNDFIKFACGKNNITNSKLERYNNMLTDSYIEPTIIEKSQHNMAAMSVFSKLFTERILFLGTEIDSDVANIINSQLLYLAMTDPQAPIKLYINTPGGSVYDGMSIYDTMQFITCPVETTCLGTAASMGEGYELFAIAGCTIGGVSVSGGTGKVSGTS